MNTKRRHTETKALFSKQKQKKISPKRLTAYKLNVTAQFHRSMIPTTELDTMLPILPAVMTTQTAIPQRYVGMISTIIRLITATQIPGRVNKTTNNTSMTTFSVRKLRRTKETADTTMQTPEPKKLESRNQKIVSKITEEVAIS